MKNIVYAFLFTSATVASVGVALFIRHRDIQKELQKRDKQFIKIIKFQGAKRAACRDHIYKSIICKLPNCAYKNLIEIEKLLERAQSSIDLCIYLLTIERYAFAILDAYDRGVKVRIITDKSMATSTGSKMRFFIENGLEVRANKSEALMHHKFALVDTEHPENKTLVTGSLNWTIQAFSGNWDNLMVTNIDELVDPFFYEFEHLWNDETAPLIVKDDLVIIDCSESDKF